MATSGSTNHTKTFDDLFILAIDAAGGDPTNADELKRAKDLTNLLLLDMANRTLLLSKLENTIVSCVVSQEEYVLDASIQDVYKANVIVNVNDYPMDRDSMEDFFEITTKTRTGRPIRYWVDRARDECTLHLLPLPNQEYNLRLKVYKLPEVVDKAYNEVDVPVRCYPAIVAGIAHLIASRRPVTEENENLVARLKNEYEMALSNAMVGDRDRASTFFYPGGLRD
jgi:hypothetical protein